LCELATQRVGRHEVREGKLAADLDHRQRFAVAALELGIVGDVDLLELERLLGANGLERSPRGRTEVALRSVVEDDPGYG
jgi:hypothetical protein